MADLRESIVEAVEGFLARSGMSESRFGLEVAKDHHLVSRLRRPSLGPGLETVERALDFIRRWDQEHAEEPIEMPGLHV